MQSLGTVLERLHTAWDHLTSAQGTLRLQYAPLATHQAWERWRQLAPSGSIQPLHVPAPPGGESDDSVLAEGTRGNATDEMSSEQYYRFWMAKPWRWRIEQFGSIAPSSSVKPQQLLIIDGGTWWSWSAGNAVHTNAQTLQPGQTQHAGVDRALLVMLDPAPLTGTLRMQVGERAEELGRRGDVVIGTARDQQLDPGLWPGADLYKLVVARDHGILLRAEALLAAQVFAATTFTELNLNQTVSADHFVFQPPPDAPDR